MISLPGVRVGAGGVAIGAVDVADDAGSAGSQAQPPTQIDIFVDYMCPYCRRFERDNDAAIQDLVDRGVTALVTHPVAILDRMSAGTMYSTRAAAAAYAVAQGAPERFGAFNARLFADQPREGGPGLGDAELANLAEQVGVPKKVGLTFADDQFVQAATSATTAALDAGLQGTPTVLLSSHHHGTFQWDGARPVAETLLALAAR
ncbi:MAG: thioredoxin domain-containing protein [Bifidobacteriaceae bacterium]|jgi:protein-disulfide isomerase|nr:thioredoxin domain-containing protein [Bifidobacteriaceae bacterium]